MRKTRTQETLDQDAVQRDRVTGLASLLRNWRVPA
jgi:hypothetical protein